MAGLGPSGAGGGSSGGGGGGTGNATLSPASGNTAGNAVVLSNTTTGVTDAGFPPAAPSAQLSKSGNFTITATEFNNQNPVIATASLTETFPLSSTLSPNGFQILQNAGTFTLTIQPNAADKVCPSGAANGVNGVAYVLPANYSAIIQTDGAGKIFVTPLPPAASVGVSTPSPSFYATTRWYRSFLGPVAVGAAAIGTGSIRWFPQVFANSASLGVDKAGARITTLASGGKIGIALYASHPTTGYPTGAPLASTGDISTTSTGFVSATLTAAVPAGGGLYWWGVQADATAATVVLESPKGENDTVGYTVGVDTQANLGSSSTVGAISYSSSGQTYGVWPTLTGVIPGTISNSGYYWAPQFSVT